MSLRTLFSLLALVSTTVFADELPPPSSGVENSPPTCVIVAKPANINLGESLTLTVLVAGEATEAEIDGKHTTLPLGQFFFTPTGAGSYDAVGTVRGPGGSTVCTTSYQVAPSACKNGNYVLKTYNEPVIHYRKRSYYEYQCPKN